MRHTPLVMEPHVVDIDRTNGDVIVAFSDGIVVRYSSALLRKMMDEAEILQSEESPEPED